MKTESARQATSPLLVGSGRAAQTRASKAAGCGGHAAGAALVAASSLPPGIRQSGQNDWRFEGTPTKSGHWKTQVTLIDLVCNGSRPDQTLPLEFDIAP
jgi:hypothetical protein